MPNWTSNHLTVTGEQTEIDRFVADTMNDNGVRAILPNIIPQPDILTGTISPTPTNTPNENWKTLVKNGEMTSDEYDFLVHENTIKVQQAEQAREATGYTNWYDWQVANWGVKWGDTATTIIDSGDGYVTFRFDTPWSPAITGFTKVAQKYPTLTFTLLYEGEGFEFIGGTRFHGDTVVTHDIDTTKVIDGPADDDGWDAYFDKIDTMRDLYNTMIEEALA